MLYKSLPIADRRLWDKHEKPHAHWAGLSNLLHSTIAFFILVSTTQLRFQLVSATRHPEYPLKWSSWISAIAPVLRSGFIPVSSQRPINEEEVQLFRSRRHELTGYLPRSETASNRSRWQDVYRLTRFTQLRWLWVYQFLLGLDDRRRF